MRRVGIVTSGGDAPGMNAAIRALVRLAAWNDLEGLGLSGVGRELFGIGMLSLTQDP